MPTLNMTDVADNNSINYAVPEIWSLKLYFEAQRLMFWAKFEGAEGSGMPVIRKDELEKDAGDKIHINTVRQLTGDGKTGSNTLEGNEEKVSMAQTDVEVDWLRHAVAINKRSRKRINFDFFSTAVRLLGQWLADKHDDAIFTKFGTATTAIYGGDATSTATLDASDTLGTTELDKIKTYLDDNLTMPLRADGDGNNYYGIVIHPYQAYNLRQDTAWKEAQRDANLRGDTNPLFTGSMGVYNGMIVFVNKGVSNTASKSKSIAFGGEAIFRGYGMMPMFQAQDHDYNFENGIGIESIYGETLNDDVNTNFAILETYAVNPNA